MTLNPDLIRLPNKLKILHTKLPVRSATALILVRAGSRYEEKRINGLAHFVEHMFFKGTKKRPTALEISTLVDGIGGEFNAFTSKEYTGYYVKASAKHIDLVMDVLADMLQNSKFDQEEVNRERGVIFEELRMYLDTPVRHVGDVYEELLYGDQPLGWDTVGTLESLKNINREHFLAFKDHFYTPENMLVVIAGGVSSEFAKDVTEKYLGDLKQRNQASFSPVKFEQKKPAVRVQYKDTQQAHLCLGVRSYPKGHPSHYKLAVLNAVLGTSMSSRLFIQLRERRGLAYYVRSGVEEYADAGSLVVQAGVEPGKIEEAVKVILEELAKLTREKVGKEELKKAKENIKGKLVLELEDSREVAAMLGLQQLLEQKLRLPREIFRRVDEVMTEDIQAVARDLFKNDKLNLAVIGPYKEEEKFVKILKL